MSVPIQENISRINRAVNDTFNNMLLFSPLNVTCTSILRHNLILLSI